MTSPEPATYAWGNTLRIRAEVLVTGGRTLSGFLHLQPLASAHSGPETPEDLLNRSEAFFPLTTDDGIRFIAKSQVLAVVVVTETPADALERRSAARPLGMKIELSDGSEVYGDAYSELPPDRPRALDFLNGSVGFFGLLGPGGTRLVNRCHVRSVTPLV